MAPARGPDPTTPWRGGSTGFAPSRGRPWPDCAALHAERRKPGVTLELLHLEYLEQHPDGYRYTQFCEIYRAGSAGAA